MDDYQIITRRRSRSKTPFLRSTCDHENCEHAGEEGHTHHHGEKLKVPSVQTIVEETVEVASSISPTKQIQKAKTSDYSSEDTSPESKSKKTSMYIDEESSQKSKQMSSSMNRSSTTTTSTTVVTKRKRVAASTPKGIDSYLPESFAAQFTGGTAAHSFKEITQNALNTESERSQRRMDASGSNNSSFNKSYSNILNSSNGDLSDHIAYLEYKRAGEYWNTTPKTDYTYSKHSSFRRELAPGIVAMPNMSRSGLRTHSERINYMTKQLIYDSGDEIDYQLDGYRKRQYNKYMQAQQQSWYMRIITTIVTTITSAWSAVAGGGGGVGEGVGVATGYDSSLYRTKYGQEERGFFGTIAHGISSSISQLFRYVYILISSLLCLDTWLLQSSNADSKGRKRFLLLLLILLPLLLLGAWWLLDEEDRAYYLQRTQALVPFSLLASWQSALYSSGNSITGYIQQLPDNVKSSFNHYYASYVAGGSAAGSGDSDSHLHIHNIEQRLQKALTAEEYENILNHVNSYVQELIDLKLTKQQRERTERAAQLSTAQLQKIADLVLESLAQDKLKSGSAGAKLGELSEAEVLQLAELVRIQLEASGWAERPVPLSSENLGEIKRLITEHMELHEHKHYTLLLERIDLDTLLLRILGAPQLAKFVDARIALALAEKQLQSVAAEKSQEGSGHSAAYSEQQRLINELNNEIAFIKLALSDKLTENEGLHQSITKLRVTQDDLLKRMQEHELATDQRFSGLLTEIESKLAALKDQPFKLLNQQIKLSLVEMLGFKETRPNGAHLEDIDLQNWVRSMFVAKDYLEERLLALNEGTDNKIRDEIDRSGMLLMRDINERLKSVTALKEQINTALSEEEVHKIVKSVLNIYDADKTGLVDFALESAGGQILSTRCTENYQTKSAQISIFGIPLWYPTNTPRIAISPQVQPGECWAFQGFPGFLVLKLNSMVYVTGFTLEHIPRSLSPNGRIDSAPRNFTVWGLEHEKDYEPVLFGEYEYVDNDASLQYFPVKNTNIKRPYEIVELRIESNHGHAQYTCLYRFRVHGKPPGA
uniref:SUN domain-containing protein 1 n=1 Tax=Zeugodacus cucurbitae TaxID=28588 RepID=A0A0A1WF31_ZEUCU